jgi:hypothetical protein
VWNEIPILPTGINIPPDATGLILNLIAPPVVSQGNNNAFYQGSYLVDDISVGKIVPAASISNSSEIGAVEGGVECRVVITNGKTELPVDCDILAAAYEGGRLIGAGILKNARFASKGNSGVNATAFDLNIPCIYDDAEALTVTAFVWDGTAGMTPVTLKKDITKPKEKFELKVLFIGNSYTYYNDLPQIFSYIAASGGHSVYQDSSTSGGYSLLQHADPLDITGGATIGKINSPANQWDYVVLQENSSMAWTDPIKFSEGAAALNSLIEARGAGSVIYQTMAHKEGDPGYTFSEESEIVRTVSRNVAESINALLAPAGDAWVMFRENYPSLVEDGLWHSDNSHPQYMGSYMNACVIYAALFNESPVGLAYDTAQMSAAGALAAQTAAAAVCGL